MQKSLKGFDLSLQSALATPSRGVPGILALQANDVYVLLDDSEKSEVKSLHLLLYNPDLHFRGLRKRDEEHTASNDGTTPVKREGLFGGLFVADGRSDTSCHSCSYHVSCVAVFLSMCQFFLTGCSNDLRSNSFDQILYVGEQKAV